MNAFKMLKEVLKENIESYDLRISSLDKRINEHDEIERIINLVDSKKDIYLSEIKRIGVYYPELNNYITLLEEIESIILSIKKGHYKEVLPDRIRIILSKIDVSSDEIVTVMNDFTMCEKLNSYIKSANCNNQIKEIVQKAYQNIYSHLYNAFQYIFTSVINEIKLKYTSSNVNPLLMQKEELEEYLKKIKHIDTLFDENKMIGAFTNASEIDFFYEWLDGKLPLNMEQEISRSIINEQENKDKNIDKIVDENRKKVFEEIKSRIALNEKKLFNKIDMNLISPTDRELILRVKDIYLEMCEKCHDRIIFSSFELGDRKSSYYQDELEWPIILADIENNLVPNINNDFENVMNAFKIITNLYSYEKNKDNHLSYRNKKIKVLEVFIHDLRELLKIENLDFTGYDYLFDEDVPYEDARYNNQYEYFAIRYFLRKKVKPFIKELENEMIRILEELENGIIEDDKGDILYIQDVKKKFEDILEEYQLRVEDYELYEESKYYDEEEEEELKEKENLVFCLDTVDFNDKHKNYDENKKKELIKAVGELESIQIDELRKPSGRKGVGDILHRTSTKNKRRKNKLHLSMVKFEDPYFEPFRYSGLADYRTGFLCFSICPENKEKLAKIYNLGKEFAVLVIFKIIKAKKGNHDDYSDFVKYIRENRRSLEDIGKMFMDPNVDIKKLCNIIDHGIEYRDDLIDGKRL